MTGCGAIVGPHTTELVPGGADGILMQSELEESGHGLCIQKRAFRGRKFERIPFRRIVAGRDRDATEGIRALNGEHERRGRYDAKIHDLAADGHQAR